MSSRPSHRRSPARRGPSTRALAVLATALTVLVVGLGTAGPSLTAVPASLAGAALTPAAAASAPSARAPLGATDPRLGERACALLGRAWDDGCLRRTCVRAADTARVNANAEMCATPAGQYYGRAVDVRTCRALHRAWIGEVNLCTSHPVRTATVVPDAPQCTGTATDYVLVAEREALWDECVTPARRRELQRVAARTGRPLAVVAAERSRTLCALRPHTSYDGTRCRDVAPTGTDGPPRGTLLVGDSLSWRSDDELAALRPGWSLDGVPGRRVTQLGPRIRLHLEGYGAPQVLVVALGTNSVVGWTKQDYVDAVALVPERTRVVLVTPYRAPADNDARAVARLDSYGRWLREIAGSRPATCLADWQARVVDDPDLLVDGTHPTPRGERVWARMVVGAVDACR